MGILAPIDPFLARIRTAEGEIRFLYIFSEDIAMESRDGVRDGDEIGQ